MCRRGWSGVRCRTPPRRTVFKIPKPYTEAALESQRPSPVPWQCWRPAVHLHCKCYTAQGLQDVRLVLFLVGSQGTDAVGVPFQNKANHGKRHRWLGFGARHLSQHPLNLQGCTAGHSHSFSFASFEKYFDLLMKLRHSRERLR